MGGADLEYGGVTLLTSAEGGRYPAANSLLVSGTEGTVLVDLSLEVGRRGGPPADVGLVAVTHAHEDHLAGLHVLPEVSVVAHPAEVAAVRDPERLLAGFGMAAAEADVFAGSCTRPSA